MATRSTAGSLRPTTKPEGEQMIRSYLGNCQCGAVLATISAEPVQVRQCWCRQCQKVSSGGPTHSAIFSAQAVAITGKLRSHCYHAASGNRLTQSFCGLCGTPVMAQSSARPEFCAIRLGFLADADVLAPQLVIWTEEAPHWAVFDANLELSPRQPTALGTSPRSDTQ